MVNKAAFSPTQPRRAKTRPFPRRGRPSEGRGGTYQASLEPLASITCERKVILPPVSFEPYVEALGDARTKLAVLFNILLSAMDGLGQGRRNLLDHVARRQSGKSPLGGGQISGQPVQVRAGTGGIPGGESLRQ